MAKTMTAAQRALAIPEILRIILPEGMLRGSSRICRVNRLFCAIGQEILLERKNLRVRKDTVQDIQEKWLVRTRVLDRQVTIGSLIRTLSLRWLDFSQLQPVIDLCPNITYLKWMVAHHYPAVIPPFLDLPSSLEKIKIVCEPGDACFDRMASKPTDLGKLVHATFEVRMKDLVGLCKFYGKNLHSLRFWAYLDAWGAYRSSSWWRKVFRQAPQLKKLSVDVLLHDSVLDILPSMHLSLGSDDDESPNGDATGIESLLRHAADPSWLPGLCNLSVSSESRRPFDREERRASLEAARQGMEERCRKNNVAFDVEKWHWVERGCGQNDHTSLSAPAP